MKKVPTEKDYDVWRKRVMAAIGGYLREMGLEQSAQIIKGVAVRAATNDNAADNELKGRTVAEQFNNIPFDRLRSIYNAFVKRQKDLRVNGVPAEHLAKMARTGFDPDLFIEGIREKATNAMMKEVEKLPLKTRDIIMREIGDPRRQQVDFILPSISEDEYDYDNIEFCERKDLLGELHADFDGSIPIEKFNQLKIKN